MTVDVDRPPYAIPAVADIMAVPPNGLTAASVFSGCGGSCLGYRWAGFDVRYACEIAEVPRASYAANFGGEPDGEDVRALTAGRVLERAGLREGELDLLDGSPPCTPFSTAGIRTKGWRAERTHAGVTQRVDDLFLEYCRLVDELRPRAFVAENVSGLAKGAAKGYLRMVYRALTASGYRVTVGLLDAQWLGVPQSRKRLYLVGLRDDVGAVPELPEPLPYRYSVRDALPHVALAYYDNSGANRQREFSDEPATLTPGSGASNAYHFKVQEEHDAQVVEADISRFAIGREWDHLQPGGQSERYFSLQKVDPERPCPTVTSATPADQSTKTGMPVGAATVTHPYERRKFTIPELRRLSGLPDDFALAGTYGQQWSQVGNIVVPPMARAVGERVARALAG